MMQQDRINNYAILFKEMAGWLRQGISKKMLANLDGYQAFVEYDSRFENMKYCNATYWDLHISSSRYSRVYFIESKDEKLNGSYRLFNGDMAKVIAMDTSIMYKESINRKSLSSFLSEYRTNIADIIRPDEYMDIFDRDVLALYGAMQILYDNFDPKKETLLAMQEEDNFKSGVRLDNTIYENFNALCNKTVIITEGKVIRAFSEGIQNVEWGSLFKTRRVSEVQETSD